MGACKYQHCDRHKPADRFVAFSYCPVCLREEVNKQKLKAKKMEKLAEAMLAVLATNEVPPYEVRDLLAQYKQLKGDTAPYTG